MSTTGTSVIVIGGGIVGLAVANELTTVGHHVRVLEKEAAVAAHQTGRNSGVIHSGLYYKPGSLKARLCVAGTASMTEFAAEHHIAHDVPGKLVVASEDRQVETLRELERRARANGVPSTWLTAEQARDIEPHVSCVAALHVHSTGRIDYAAVTRKLTDLVTAQRGEVLLGQQVTRISETPSGVLVATDHDEFHADLLVNCAGLHSDRVAQLGGLDPDVRIVPFRGEYYELDEAHTDLVRGLVYPVPDPDLPFLGVHLTRGLDGTVHAGPNAVLAGAREGYTWTTLRGRDLLDTVTWPGFRPLAPHLLEDRCRGGGPVTVPPQVRERLACPSPRTVDRGASAGAGRRTGTGDRPGRLAGGRLPLRPISSAAPRPERALARRDCVAGDRQAHRGGADSTQLIPVRSSWSSAMDPAR